MSHTVSWLWVFLCLMSTDGHCWRQGTCLHCALIWSVWLFFNAYGISRLAHNENLEGWITTNIRITVEPNFHSFEIKKQKQNKQKPCTTILHVKI